MSNTETAWRPVADRILIKRLTEDEKTAGGLFIPTTAKEKPSRGTVVAVGPGRIDEAGKLNPPSVKPGDTVLFGKYSGSEIKLEHEDMVVLRDDEILLVKAAA